MRSQKGQATVELALCFAFLLLILFGIIDFGRIFFAYTNLEHTGKEVGRAVSLGRTDVEATDVLKNTTSLNTNNLAVTITPSAASRKQGVYATVQQSYELELSTPFLSNLFSGPITIKNKTVVRIE